MTQHSHQDGTIAVCTIVAKNYLALAKTLAASAIAKNPHIRFHLFVVDPPGLDTSAIDSETIRLVEPTEIMSAEQYNRMAAEYDVTEFSTSVKPFLLRHLLNAGYAKAIYFDPDILVLQPLAGIEEALEESNIVLTPHLLDPIPIDDYLPNEISILRAGAYNLGFIGIRASSETRRFLDWWAERLDRFCYNDVRHGLFADQKWIDLVPGLYQGVGILRQPGLNVAYWNLHSRHVVNIDGMHCIDDKDNPIVFFHFSGFDPAQPTEMSKHQTRLTLSAQPTLAKLFAHYAKLLQANGHTEHRSYPYTPYALSGVNVAGYLTSEAGVGEAARGYIRSIEMLDYGLALNDFSQGSPSRRQDNSLSGFTEDNPHDINLVCVNADQVKRFRRRFGKAYMAGKFNIGVWWWELPEFPAKWHRRFRHFDQIWVGSEFARQSIQSATRIPVIVIPPVVSVERGKSYNKTDFGFSEDEFILLFMFDFFSIFERKNPLAVIEAFKQAFHGDERVRLVIKSINGEKAPEALALLQQAAQDPRITLVSDYMSREDKNGLIAIADCYVSLHRSEGFGYTMAEAMLLGKPVIATNWSGNTDFMTAQNSYPVDYQLTTLTADHGPYKAGQTWADPDTSHAAALMLQVYQHPEAARRKGEQAARDIAARHSTAAVAQVIRKTLMDIDPTVKRPKERKLKQLLQRLTNRKKRRR